MSRACSPPGSLPALQWDFLTKTPLQVPKLHWSPLSTSFTNISFSQSQLMAEPIPPWPPLCVGSQGSQEV